MQRVKKQSNTTTKATATTYPQTVKETATDGEGNCDGSTQYGYTNKYGVCSDQTNAHQRRENMSRS